MPLGTQEALSHLKKTYQWIDTFKHQSLFYLSQHLPKPDPTHGGQQERVYLQGCANSCHSLHFSFSTCLLQYLLTNLTAVGESVIAEHMVPIS